MQAQEKRGWVWGQILPKTAGMARNATGARQVGHFCRKSQSTHYSSGQALKGLPLFISRRSVCLGSPLGDPTGRTRAALVPPCATRIGDRASGVFLQRWAVGQTIPIGPGTRTGDSHRRRHKQAFLQERAGSTGTTSLPTHGPPLGRTSRDKEHKFALSGNGQLAVDAAHMGAHGTF